RRGVGSARIDGTPPGHLRLHPPVPAADRRDRGLRGRDHREGQLRLPGRGRTDATTRGERRADRSACPVGPAPTAPWTENVAGYRSYPPYASAPSRPRSSGAVHRCLMPVLSASYAAALSPRPRRSVGRRPIPLLSASYAAAFLGSRFHG